MERYTLTSYNDASPATKVVYDEYLRLSGAAEPPVWMASLGHSSTLLKGYWEKAKGTLLEGDLPFVLKVMVSFVVSRENGAEYCTIAHAHSALQLDTTLTYHDLVTILDPHGSVPLTPAHRAAVEFAAKMARDATSVTDEDFEALTKAGYTNGEIKELLSVIDLSMMINCYTIGMRLPLDPEYKSMPDFKEFLVQ